MKKLLLVLLAVLLILSMVACGGPSETESNAPETETDDTSGETGKETPGGYDASFDRSTVKDDVPEDLKFNGETVTFFVRTGSDELYQYEMDVDTLMNDTLYDAIYWRNKTVEDRLGITITTINQPGDYDKRVSWNDTLRTAVNTKSGDFDTAAIYLSTGTVLAVEGLYYNVIDFPYISLEKPWWNQSIRDELTMFSTLYYLAGDIAASEITRTYCLFYNKDLFEKYYGKDGVDLNSVIHDKKWTLDYMYDLVAGAYDDADASGTKTDGDTVGFMTGDPNKQDSWNDAWITACGIDITTKESGIPELSFYSERTLRAFDAVQRLCFTCPGTFATNEAMDSTTFINGKVLFGRGSLGAGAKFREMKDSYGVIPLPMLEENQEGGYSTTFANIASVVTVLSSLPDERKELVGATLELMAAESYKQVTPSYCEVALKTKYSESLEDSKIYDLILNSVKISFGYCYSTETLKGGPGGLSIGSLFRILNSDLAQEYDKNDEVYQTNLTNLINGLDEVAFKAMYGE